jgi:tripartite-type tricarboxylate transporter receptor subunit TctC
VPTISEAGVPGYEAIIWFGLLAPAATPREIVAKIGQAVTALVRSPEMRERFAAQGADAIGSGAQEFARFLQSDMEKYARIVKLSGARAD